MISSGSGRWTSVRTLRMRSRRAPGSSRVWVLSTSSICAPQLMTGLSAVIGSWKIIAMRVQRSARRRLALACSRSSPCSRMRPATGVSWPLGKSPMMLCAVTDLPEPDSPTRQRISRAPTVRLTSSTAWRRSAPFGSATVRPSIASAGASTAAAGDPAGSFTRPALSRRGGLRSAARGAGRGCRAGRRRARSRRARSAPGRCPGTGCCAGTPGTARGPRP